MKSSRVSRTIDQLLQESGPVAKSTLHVTELPVDQDQSDEVLDFLDKEAKKLGGHLITVVEEKDPKDDCAALFIPRNKIDRFVTLVHHKYKFLKCTEKGSSPYSGPHDVKWTPRS